MSRKNLFGKVFTNFRRVEYRLRENFAHTENVYGNSSNNGKQRVITEVVRELWSWQLHKGSESNKDK